MNQPTPLIDAMTGEVVGYEIKPGDAPVVLGLCLHCSGPVTTYDDEVFVNRDGIAHIICARWL